MYPNTSKSAFIIISLSLHFGITKKYNHYTLFRSLPVNEAQLNFLEQIGQIYEVIYWRPPGTVNKSVEFLISPDQRNNLVKQAELNHVNLTTIFPDIQKIFDEQTVRTYTRRNIDSYNWQNFYRINDIYDWLQDLNKAYPNVTRLHTIGRTFEGRNIMAVRIALLGSKMRSSVIIEGGIHAREWISPAFVTYMIHQILHAPDSKDAPLKKIALTYEWFFIPVLNPDGYEYSHTQDRMWRKNRRDGHGVDLNRNFDIEFGGVGVSKRKYSEIYCGHAAFSEKESSALADFVKSKNGDLEYYFTFHNYGQHIILPYAHLSEHVDNFEEMKQKGLSAASRIARRYKTQYTIGTAKETVGYMTTGVSDSWVKKTFRVPFVASFELRDTGTFGFALPPKYILPTCQETMDGMLSLLTPQTVNYTKLNYPYSYGQQCATLEKHLIFLGSILLSIINHFV